ncbi:hypothetical protein [Halorussus halobius]|uniref:hypothetical protein n=1 Tax=Halorussus halobius TaxID=1710537 RepID=UPI001092C9C9|nr:hypothetical protein [Halorussus halobius]
MELDSNFEDDLRDAILDAGEEHAADSLADEYEALLREKIEAYGSQHDYDVSTLLAGLSVEVDRTGDAVRLRARLPDPALLFERGTARHEVEAKNADVLSFIWSEGGRGADPPEWVREEYERESDGWRVFLPSVEVEGLPEGRFIRDTLAEIRRRAS